MCVILKYLVYFVPSECRSVNFRFRLAWIICCIIPHVTGSVKLLFPPTTFIFVYNSTLILFWPWHFLNFSSCVQHVYSQLRRFFCHVTVTNVSLRRRPLLGTVSWDSRHFETVLQGPKADTVRIAAAECGMHQILYDLGKQNSCLMR